MAQDSVYPAAYERWTWKRQLMDAETKILSQLRTQYDAWCSYFATATTMECNLRVQLRRSLSLSIPHVKRLYDESRIQASGKIKKLLLTIKEEGVIQENQYEAILRNRLRESDARRYKILKYTAYNMDNPLDIKAALYQLRRGGPLLAVIRISQNYNECKHSGAIYRYDPSQMLKDQDGNPKTHALCVVSFAVEAGVPCLECQDSRGAMFGRAGFLMVDVISLIELYSIRVR